MHRSISRQLATVVCLGLVGAVPLGCVSGGGRPVVTTGDRDWVAALDWATAGSSPDELKKLYRDTARRVYRI